MSRVRLLQNWTAADSSFPNDPNDISSLTEVEKHNVRIYRRSKDGVAFVVSLSKKRVQDPVSLDVSNVPAGSGTGFVWDKDGHIVTNAHVAKVGTAGWNVVLSTNQESIPCDLVGMDIEGDVAVLKMKNVPRNLKVLPRSKSNFLHVGQKVYAIGNPFGIGETLTSGIISGLGRELPVDPKNGIVLRGLIQTDAAINPGNSGGPLLDSKGQVIGVNTAILSPSGSSAGIGLALSIADVTDLVEDIVKFGSVQRPRLGVSMAPDQTYYEIRRQARDKGLLPPGVLVFSVQGAAAAAGIKPTMRDVNNHIILGDVITAFNGRNIRYQSDLIQALRDSSVGDEATIEVYRDGRNVILTALLTSREGIILE